MKFILVLTLFFLSIRWPGDVPWINDEPLFFQRVLRSLETGKWWIMALPGSAGITYGPVAWWFYRVFWPLTHSLEAIVVIKAVLSQGICFGFSVLTLSLLKLPRRIALLILVSPYYFLYSRVLWDNCFLLPFLSILLYLVVRFQKAPAIWILSAFSLVTWLALHTHLMAGVFILPAALTLLGFHRSWWREHIRAVGMLIFLSGLSFVPYLMETGKGPSVARFARADVFALSVLFWPRFFSPIGFGDYFFPGLELGWGRWFIYPLGAIPFLLVWLGLYRFYSEKRWLFRLCVSSLFLLGLLHWIFSLQTHPHYAIPASGLALICLARGYRSLERFRPTPALGFLFLVMSIWFLNGFSSAVHERGGDRAARYGAVLSNQIQVARQLGQQGEVVEQGVENYIRFPHSLSVLRRLVAESTEEGRQWKVNYRDADTRSGWIVAEEGGTP